MDDTDLGHLRRCLELALVARARGDEPFGSLVVGGSGTVLAERENAVHTTGDVTAHPELMLAAWASRTLTPEERAAATMYTSCEHCAMCAAAHHWAGIGRLVFALSGAELNELAPAGVPVLELSSREVLARGSNSVEVAGPSTELAAEARAVFDGMWAS